MFLRFLLIGGFGFLIDTGITNTLAMLSTPSWAARIPAIATAMIFTWIANRHFTYNTKQTYSKNELIRYATVAATMAILNYVIYIILVKNGVQIVAAITIATASQSVISYYLYRHIVFKK